MWLYYWIVHSKFCEDIFKHLMCKHWSCDKQWHWDHVTTPKAVGSSVGHSLCNYVNNVNCGVRPRRFTRNCDIVQCKINKVGWIDRCCDLNTFRFTCSKRASQPDSWSRLLPGVKQKQPTCVTNPLFGWQLKICKTVQHLRRFVFLNFSAILLFHWVQSGLAGHAEQHVLNSLSLSLSLSLSPFLSSLRLSVCP